MTINIQKNDEINRINTPAAKASDVFKSVDGKVTETNANTFAAFVKSTGDGILSESLAGKELQAASAEQLDTDRDKMILMSHTLSEEDYKKLEEEGFDLSKVDLSDSVTIVDKIKAEVLKSGKQIAGYNDDMDAEILEKALGNPDLAAAVLEQFAQNDIPVNEDNAKDLAEAFEMISGIEEIGAGEEKYMLANNLRPTVFNLHMAESAGAAGMSMNSAKYIKADNYVMELGQGAAFDGIDEEIERLSNEVNGADVPEEELPSIVKKLVELGEPVSEENAELLYDIESVEFPVPEEVFAKAAVNAINAGKSAKQADLSNTETLSDRLKALERALDMGINREETRFKLTSEVNLAFLKQGISFDTSKIEEIVEALREAKNQLADRYFPKDLGAVDKYDTFVQTNETVLQIKDMPVAMLGDAVVANMQESLEDFAIRGASFKIDLEKAGEEYEIFFTEVRADLGDSITKAFGNVDDILDDLNIEKDDDSRRAVRILGRNSMEITPENISKVEDAYLQVKDVVDGMKPGVVLKMVREGINPLKMDFNELQEYLKTEAAEFEEEATDYAKFLYRLEQKSDITPEEREGFISIYKMLNRIAQGDYSSIGAVLDENAVLNLQNLLTAATTKKSGGIDARLAEDTQIKLNRMVKGDVTAQIERAFAKNALEVMNQTLEENVKKQDNNYKEYVRGLKETALVEEFSQIGMLNTTANLNAFAELVGTNPSLFAPDKEKKDFISALTDQLVNSFFAADDEEEFKAEYKEEIKEAEQIAKEQVKAADTSVDVKSMRLVHKQLAVAERLADDDEYFIPLKVGDEMAKVRIRFNDLGEKASLRFNIFLEEGQTEAVLFLERNEIYGAIKENGAGRVMNLKQIADNFNSRISSVLPEGYRMNDLVLTNTTGEGSIRREANIDGMEAPDRRTLFVVAKEFLRAF